MRFSKLGVQVDGPLTPGSDVHLSVEARGDLPAEQTHLRLTFPELSALNAKKHRLGLGPPFVHRAHGHRPWVMDNHCGVRRRSASKNPDTIK